MTDLEKLEANIEAVDTSMASVQMAMKVAGSSEPLQKALADLVAAKNSLISLRAQLISKES